MAVRSLPDVVVIGGGIIGASIAWRLAQRGAAVAVYDAGRLGGEASWAGAGMLVPGSEYFEASPAFSFAQRSLSLYPEFVAELEQESGVSIDFSLCGCVELGETAQEMAMLAARAGRQRLAGLMVEDLRREDLRSRVPQVAPFFEGGLFYPNEGQVDPRTVMAALAEAGRRRGVAFHENCPALGLQWNSDGVTVSLAGGPVRAGRAVIAAGAWSSSLPCPTPLPETFPVRGHLVGYRLNPGALPFVVRHDHTYLVQRRHGLLVAGASEERVGFAREVEASTAAGLAARARRVAPEVIPSSPDERWIGFRPGVAGDQPHLGRLEGTPLWLAYGHYRNGILLAPATAERIAQELTSSSESPAGAPV